MMVEKTPSEDPHSKSIEAEILADMRDRLEGLDSRLTAYLDSFVPSDAEEPEEALTPRDEGFWESRLVEVDQVQERDVIMAANGMVYRVVLSPVGEGVNLRARSEHGYQGRLGDIPKPWHLIWRKRPTPVDSTD